MVMSPSARLHQLWHYHTHLKPNPGSEQPRRTVQAARRNEYHSDDTGLKVTNSGPQTNGDNNMDFSLTQNPNTENVTKDLPPFKTAAAKDENMSDKPAAAAANAENNNDKTDKKNVAGKQEDAHHTDTEVNTKDTNTKTD